MKTVVFMPGRFAPLHKGHVKAFLWLLSVYNRLIIGIGSCYEAGTKRHPLSAVHREKMILLSLQNEGVDLSRVTIVHLQDFHNWDKWWGHITEIAWINFVTHFATSNHKDIVSVMRSKKIKPPFTLIDIEKKCPLPFDFPYHATDLRRAIEKNDYNFFLKLAAFGTVQLMGNAGGFAGIRQALKETGTKFILGRQTVDLIVTCELKEKYVLCGYRSMKKENFPGRLGLPGGGIDEYESPMDAAVRELEEETGLIAKIINRALEPAHVRLQGIISEMKYVGLFSTDDPNFGGNQGGSSQVFHIYVDAETEVFKKYLKSRSDLDKVKFRKVKMVLKEGLAYQQNDMLKKALSLF
jgi:nicotinamide mononucleotide adenylyltransferase/8-oxo-dGTP pyrophosphatase MutT (NUDIX family)